MKGMLIKDFSLLKGQKHFLLAVAAVSFLLLFVTEQYYFGVGYVGVMFEMFSLSTIAYDEYDNGNPFLFTLPISRKGYVKEKYVFGLLTALGGCIVNMVLIVVMQIAKKDSGADIQVMFVTMAGALAAGMVMIAFTMPLQFKFGSEKRQIAMMISFIIVFFVVFCGQSLTDRFGVPGFVKKLSGMSIESIAALSAAIVIALVCASYLVSVRIMEKKEF